MLRHERFLSLSCPPHPATTLKRNHRIKCLQIPGPTVPLVESSPVIHRLSPGSSCATFPASPLPVLAEADPKGPPRCQLSPLTPSLGSVGSSARQASHQGLCRRGTQWQSCGGEGWSTACSTPCRAGGKSSPSGNHRQANAASSSVGEGKAFSSLKP